LRRQRPRQTPRPRQFMRTDGGRSRATEIHGRHLPPADRICGGRGGGEPATFCSVHGFVRLPVHAVGRRAALRSGCEPVHGVCSVVTGTQGVEASATWPPFKDPLPLRTDVRLGWGVFFGRAFLETALVTLTAECRPSHKASCHPRMHRGRFDDPEVSSGGAAPPFFRD